MSENFYSQLSPFKNFENFVEQSYYQNLPDDWLIFVADIKDSTLAIDEGRYKEVNLIGAASITLSIQALKNFEFPFVFGGDGATICIPPAYENRISEELGKLIRFAKDNFSLHLRVAKIPAKK